MSITCKRVDFNNGHNNVLNIQSSTIKDHHCNTIHSIFIQPKYPIDCNIEVIGKNIHIQKDIPKKQSESSIDYITIVTKNIDTPLFIKLVVSKEYIGEKSTIIYLGDYMFTVLSFPIHDKVNIYNSITKKIEVIDDEEQHNTDDEEQHNTNYEEQHNTDDESYQDDEQSNDDTEDDTEDDKEYDEDRSEDEQNGDGYITPQKRLQTEEYKSESGLEDQLN